MHRARIERAVVRLRAVTSRSRNATLRMQLVEHYNAQPPSGGGAEHIPSSRTFGDASVDWKLAAWQAQDEVTSPDLSPLVQHLVDRVLWKPGNSIMLQITLVSSDCTAAGSDCTAIFTADIASNAPKLDIYSVCKRPPSMVHIYSLQAGDRSRQARAYTSTLLPTRANGIRGQPQIGRAHV